MTMLLAEVRKLKRPLFLWLSLAMVLLSFIFATMTQQTASASIENMRAGLQWATSSPTPSEEEGIKPGTPEYDQWVKEQVANAEQGLKEMQESALMAGATQHPLGAAGLGIAFVCGLPGLFIMLIAAGVSVGGEWSGKTVKEILAADSRRARLVCTKMATMFIFGIWLTVISCAALVLWGFLSQNLWPIEQVASIHTTQEWVTPMLVHAPLVLAFFSVLTVLLAVLLRHPITTLLAGAVVTFVLTFAARFQALAKYSPASWVAAMMDFRAKDFLYDSIWAYRPEGLSASTGTLYLFVLVVFLAVAAIVVTVKRDVLA